MARTVSVPLRGLDMWKQATKAQDEKYIEIVSVPLRGLDMWKLYATNFGSSLNYAGFSPLAGIRYVETAFFLCSFRCALFRFQSPCGD